MTQNEGAYSGSRTVKNAWSFLLGKGFSAFCTLGLLGAVVRFLPLSEYSVYISFVALIETGIALSLFGLDWAIIRYIPQYFSGGPYPALKRFITSITCLRIIILLLFSSGAILAFNFSNFAQFNDRHNIVLLAAALFISEGILRLLRDNTLESLANQAKAQIGNVIRQCTFLAIVIGMEWLDFPAIVENVLFAELTASIIAMIFSVVSVKKSIGRIKDRAQVANWSPPVISQVRSTALYNYAGALLSYPYSLQALVLLVVAVVGVDQAASFGFVVRIVEILRGYLPAFLFMNVLRPRIFSVFETTNNFDKPNSETRLISRLSFFTIFPLIVLVALYGNFFIELASGGRIQAGRELLLLFFASLVFRLQRQTATLLINCVKLSTLLVRNAFYSLLAFPIIILLLYKFNEVLVLGFAVLVDELIWVATSAYFLRRNDYFWSTDLIMISKLSIVSIICYFAIDFFHLPDSLFGIALSSLITVLFFLVYAFIFKPLGTDLHILLAALPSGRHKIRK